MSPWRSAERSKFADLLATNLVNRIFLHRQLPFVLAIYSQRGMGASCQLLLCNQANTSAFYFLQGFPSEMLHCGQTSGAGRAGHE